MTDARTSSGDEWAEEHPNTQPAWISTDYVDENAANEEDIAPQRSLSRRRSMECSSIELHIVNTEVNQDHTVYVIEVTCGIRHWTVKRRYKDFDYLDRKLRKFLPAVTMPSLPAKSYWRSSNNPSIVEQRKLQLQDYLRALLGMNQIWARNDLVLFLNDESNIMTFIWSVERMRRLKEMLRLTKVDNPNEADKINSDLEEARKQVDELQAKLSQMEMIFLQQATGAASQQLSSTVLRSLSRADNPLSLQLALEMSQEHASLYQEGDQHDSPQHVGDTDKNQDDDDLQVDIAGPEATGARFSDYNEKNHVPSYVRATLPPMEPEELLKALSLAQRQESVADIMNNNTVSPSKNNTSDTKSSVSTNDARTLTISYEIQEALRISEELLLSTTKHKSNNAVGSHHSDSETSSRNGQMSHSLSGLAVTSSVDAVMKGLLHQEATAAISQLLDFDYNRNVEDGDDTSQISCQWVGEIFSLTDSLLSSLQPSTLSLDLRQQIFKYVRDLLARTVGGQAFPYGSFISHTFLPDGDLDITSFVPNNYHSTTTTTNTPSSTATAAADNDAASSEPIKTTTTTTKVLSHDKENAWYVKVNEALCFAAVASQERQLSKAQPSVTQTNGVYAFDELFVSNVSFVNNGEIKEIRCQVNDVRVDIATNQLTSIMMETLIERVDEFVGKNHLFKRALLLIKSWLKYDAFALTGDNSAQQETLWDKLPTAAVVVIVIYIFQYEGEHISSPLQVLLHFFLTMLNFDWGKFAMTIHGMVKISEVEQHVSSYHYQSPTFHYHHHHHRHHHNNHHNKNNNENKVKHVRFFPDSLFDFTIGDEIRSERPPALQRDKSKENNQNNDKKDTKESEDKHKEIASEAVTEVPASIESEPEDKIKSNENDGNTEQEQSELDSSSSLNQEGTSTNVNATTNTSVISNTVTNLPPSGGRTRHHHNHKEYKSGIFNILDPFQSQHNLFGNLELQDIESMVSAVVNGYKHIQAVLDTCSKQNTPTNSAVKNKSHLMETFWRNSLLKSKVFDGMKNDVTVVSENKDVEDIQFDVLQSATQDLQFSRFYGSIALGGKIELATLTQMILIILDKRGPMPVGEIGKNLQAILGCENLSRRLKEQFTGLKRAIEHANTPRLKVGSEHQFNPVVTLVGDAPVLPDYDQTSSDSRWMFHHAGYMFTPYQIHLAMQAQVAKEAQLLLQRNNNNATNAKNNNKSSSPSVATPPLSVSPVNNAGSLSSSNAQAYHNNTNSTNSQMMRNRGNSGSNFRSIPNNNSSTNSSISSSSAYNNQQQHSYSPNARNSTLSHQMRSPNRRNNNNAANYNNNNTSPNYPAYYPHHPPPPTMPHHHGPPPPMPFFPPTFLPVPVPVTFDPVTGAPMVAPPPASPLASSYGSYNNNNAMMYQQHPTLQPTPNNTNSNSNLSPTSSVSPTASSSDANNNASNQGANTASVPVPVPMAGYYMPPPPPPYAMYAPNHNNANNNIAQSPSTQIHYFPPPPFPNNGLVPPIPIPGYYQPANGNVMMGNNNNNVSYSYHHSLSNSLSSSYGTSNMHYNNANYTNNNVNTTNNTNNTPSNANPANN